MAMHHRRILVIWSLAVCALFGAPAQSASGDTTGTSSIITQLLAALEAQGAADSVASISVPSSPAFVLMGVTPSSVEQPGNIRDYKLDFATQAAFKTPDVSLELRPLWLTWLGHDKGFTSWPWIKKVLSSFGLAAGVVNQTEDTTATALAATIGLYQAANPLYDKAYLLLAAARIGSAEETLNMKEDNFGLKLKRCTTSAESLTWKSKIASIDSLKQALRDSEARRIISVNNDYQTKHWNSPQIEIGGGWRSNLDWLSESDFQFDSTGWAAWVTACTGIGPSILVSGMYRYASNLGGPDHTVGFNLRWGGPKSGLFAEVLFDITGDKGHISYGGGGQYSVNRNVQIQYGVRTAKNGVFGISPTLGLSLMPSKG
jgi:hypothetical protein